MHIASLFPHLKPLYLDRVLVVDGRVHVEVRRRTLRAGCPRCRRRTHRVHSTYSRHLADLPMAGQPVVLHWRVRRFRCANRRCSRRTFAEQSPALVARYARRTEPLREALEQVGLALGGRPGQRLGARLGLLATRDTLLQLVRALPEPAVPAPRVVGVDEFALRRGRVYGTVLVDVERQRPIDLLDDRSADQFATWLAQRAAPEVICRDRGGCYAEGASRGAPDAVQVADRWHLLHNLTEAVERVAVQHAGCWREDPLVVASTTTPESVRQPPTTAPAAGRLAERHRERHTQIQTLVARGMTITAIARTLHLDRKTVRTFARAGSVDALGGTGRRGTSPLLAPFVAYLNRRWQEGCEDGKQLFAEVRLQGYRGSHCTLGRALTALRRGAPPRPSTQPITARAVAGLILRRPEALDVTETALLERLFARCEDASTTARLARAFATLVRERRGAAALRTWLDEVGASGLTALDSFAKGLRRYEAAVAAGLTLPWSSGVVEGHNTRIKLIKRQMYGRANFDVLRRRVLLAS